MPLPSHFPVKESEVFEEEKGKTRGEIEIPKKQTITHLHHRNISSPHFLLFLLKKKGLAGDRTDTYLYPSRAAQKVTVR